MEDVFLQLVRLGIGNAATEKLPDHIDWDEVEVLAKRQGLMGIIYDAVQEFKGLRGSSQENLPPLTTWLRWIGEVQLEEERYIYQWNEACKMAQLFHQNNIRTYVLKGNVVSECYPKPQHRVSADFDCFLVNENQNENEKDVWEKGNQLIEEAGYEVEKVFYKNSTFHLHGLTVENHRYMVPFRGNRRLKQLERWFQSQFKSLRVQEVQDVARFKDTWLYRPPVMVSALFLIEHAYSHFLHEGLTWRHVLDWVMFSRKHEDEINWKEFDDRIDEFRFRKFYNAFSRLGQYLIGEIQVSSFTSQEKKMLADIWAPLDLHESVRGFKGKLALVGNTWRARWKYHYFTDMSWFTALWIQVKGYLFEKNPVLD